MSTRQWLADSLAAASPVVVAALGGHGLSWDAARDLAAEGLSFAAMQALDRKPNLDTDQHRRNWLARVAINHAFDVLASERRHRRTQDRLYEERRDGAMSAPLQPFLELMHDALAQLSAEDRRIVERYFLDGATLRELVDEGDLGSIPTAHRRIRAILVLVRTILEDQGAVPDGWESPDSPAP